MKNAWRRAWAVVESSEVVGESIVAGSGIRLRSFETDRSLFSLPRRQAVKDYIISNNY